MLALSATSTAAAIDTTSGQTLSTNCNGSTAERLQCHAADIKSFLRLWVRSWGDGDFDTYISLYTAIRSPVEDLDRLAWEKNRRERISPDKDIEINLKLESMGLEDSGIFDIIFEQQYRSNNYSDVVRKRLFLVNEMGELKIWKEEILSTP